MTIPFAATREDDKNSLREPRLPAAGTGWDSSIVCSGRPPVKLANLDEERLRHRLEAFSYGAAAFAHEINQPLAATATYLSVAGRMLGKSGDREIAQILEKATAQTQRASRLVANLRDLLPCGEADKTLASLHALLEESLESLRADGAPDAVGFRLEPAALHDNVMADRLQIRLALCNLLRAAAAATRAAGGRDLAIRTSNLDTDAIRVEMSDAGSNHPEPFREPDFEVLTLKKAKDIGLGVLSSLIILEDHDGRIWTAQTRQGGALFSLILPLEHLDVTS